MCCAHQIKVCMLFLLCGHIFYSLNFFKKTHTKHSKRNRQTQNNKKNVWNVQDHEPKHKKNVNKNKIRWITVVYFSIGLPHRHVCQQIVVDRCFLHFFFLSDTEWYRFFFSWVLNKEDCGKVKVFKCHHWFVWNVDNLNWYNSNGVELIVASHWPHQHESKMQK